MSVCSRCAAAMFFALLPLWPSSALGLPVLYPVDEATTRPDFFTFRAQLQTALASRDTAAVLDALDPHIRLSFGGDGGIDDFKHMWLSGNSNYDLWKQLGKALALGGSFMDQSTFAAPYVYSRWPDSLDAFDHVAVIGSRVRVRADPRADAEVLTSLSFSVVKVRTRQRWSDDWVPVELEDGREGYIARPLIHGPVMYRAIFKATPAGWKMTAFVAGD